jgi:hypothetical protein
MTEKGLARCVAPACVECAGMDDCQAKHQTCKANACVPCTFNGDCTTGACLDGVCLDENQAVYVDNTVTCPGQGTHAVPSCTITLGIAAANGSSLTKVVVAGSATNYVESVDLTNQKLTLLGPGIGAAKVARIQPGTAPSILAGNGTDAVVDGFELGMTTSDAVTCLPATSAKLFVRRSHIHDAIKSGVTTNNCDLKLDSDWFDHDTGAGISVTAGSYAITNCTVQNGGTAVTLINTTGMFINNTILANMPAAGVGGIVCSPPQPIEASIIWGNRKVGTSQVSGCTVADSVLDETASGTNKNGPAPDLTADGHLSGKTPNNKLCCVDQLLTAMVPTDRDGKPRPQPNPGKADIGSHEWPQ